MLRTNESNESQTRFSIHTCNFIQDLISLCIFYVVDPAPLGPDRNDDISKLIYRYLA